MSVNLQFDVWFRDQIAVGRHIGYEDAKEGWEAALAAAPLVDAVPGEPVAREKHQPTNREDADSGNVNAIRHVAYGEGYAEGKAAALAAPVASRAGMEPVAQDLAKRGLLGVIGTAQAQARRILASEGDADDLRQDRRDLPGTLDVIRNAVESRYAAIAPAAPAEPSEPEGEREAFERITSERLDGCLDYTRDAKDPDRYDESPTDFAWEGWMARATLPTTPAPADSSGAGRLAVPLTDEQIDEVQRAWIARGPSYYENGGPVGFARAIEAAHGIGAAAEGGQA